MFRLIGLLSRIALRLVVFYLVVIGLVATGGFAGVGPLAEDLAGQDVPVVGISAETVDETVSGTPVAGLSDAVSDSAADIERRVADGNTTADGNATADGNTSAEERRVERLIHEDINSRRAAEGLDPLQRDADLRRIARNHSTDMVVEGYVGHESPDGVTPGDRLSSAGCRAGGENVAQSWIDEPVDVDGETIVADDERELATHLVNRWMASPGHRENVLRESFAESGIGVEITDDNRVYATQNFCRGSLLGGGFPLRYNQIHQPRRR